MEMSSQLQAAATLLLREEPLITTGQELGGTHRWMLWKAEKSLACARNQMPVHRTHSLVTKLTGVILQRTHVAEMPQMLSYNKTN